MCCHIFKDNAFVLVSLTETGRAGAEKTHLFPVPRIQMGFFNADKDLFCNTDFSEQDEQPPPPPLKCRQCI